MGRKKVPKMREWFVYFPQGSLQPQLIPVTISSTDSLLTFLYITIGCESIETVRTGSGSEVVMIMAEEGLFNDMLKPNLIGTALDDGLIFGGIVLAKEGQRDGEPDIVGFDNMPEAHHIAECAQKVAKEHFRKTLHHLMGDAAKDHYPEFFS